MRIPVVVLMTVAIAATPMIATVMPMITAETPMMTTVGTIMTIAEVVVTIVMMMTIMAVEADTAEEVVEKGVKGGKVPFLPLFSRLKFYLNLAGI